MCSFNQECEGYKISGMTINGRTQAAWGVFPLDEYNPSESCRVSKVLAGGSVKTCQPLKRNGESCDSDEECAGFHNQYGIVSLSLLFSFRSPPFASPV